MGSHGLCRERRLWPGCPLKGTTEPLSASPLAFLPRLGEQGGLPLTLLTRCSPGLPFGGRNFQILLALWFPLGRWPWVCHWRLTLLQQLILTPFCFSQSLTGNEVRLFPQPCQFCWMSIAPYFDFLRALSLKYERLSPRLSQILFNCLCLVTSKDISSSPKINMFYGRSLGSLTLFFLRMNFLSFRVWGKFAELDCKF